MKKEILFIAANAHFPRGQLWSTARKGEKWMTEAKPGDVLVLMETESKKILGKATLVKARVDTFNGACAAAATDNNHALMTNDPKAASDALAHDLRAAYGPDLKPHEPFTILHLMSHNEDAVSGSQAS